MSLERRNTKRTIQPGTMFRAQANPSGTASTAAMTVPISAIATVCNIAYA